MHKIPTRLFKPGMKEKEFSYFFLCENRSIQHCGFVWLKKFGQSKKPEGK